MSSLIQQLENNRSQSTIYNHTLTNTNIQHNPKIQKNRKNIATYGITAPIATAIGGYTGYDKFIKEKKTIEKTVKYAESLKLDTQSLTTWNYILANFSDLALRIKEDLPTDMPNCLMVKGQDKRYCQRMIDWIGKTPNANFTKIVGECDDIVELVESLERKFQKTKTWNLLYINDFEKYIDHARVDDWVVEGMKDIMSAIVDYHTTIIFSTDNPKKLDKIALQPHRVRRTFDLDKIDEKLFFETEAKIDLLEQNVKKLEQHLKTRNNKIVKYAAIGLMSGTGIAAAINYGIKILKNKNIKEKR